MTEPHALADVDPWGDDEPSAPAPRRNGSAGHATLAPTRYEVRDASGALVAVHVRTPDKRLWWELPDGTTGLDGTSPRQLPLYAIERLEGPSVLLVEGEKVAQALIDAGIPAVGTVTGAGHRPDDAALSDLSGKLVYLAPDADEAGRQHMASVVNSLRRMASYVGWIEPPADVAKGWDLADALLEPGRGVDWIHEQIAKAGDPPGSDVVERLGIRLLSEISSGPPAPLLIDRLDPEGPSMLYGTGGVGKGTLAAWWIVQLVQAGHVVLIVDYEAHPTEWARRITSLGGLEVAGQVHHVSPSSADWTGPRGAIWQHADELRQAADAVKATYLFVDSVAVACGAVDVLKPEAPGQYHTALALIGRPSCSLAHITKGEDTRYPFGSIFWHNLSRVTWSIAKQSPVAGEHAIVLSSRKANNYAGLGKHAVAIEWWEGKPREVTEQPYSARIVDLVAEIIAEEGPLTYGQVTDRLNEDLGEGEAAYKKDSVRAALRRAVPKRFTVSGTGDRATYGLAEESVA